jgi:hypothetical protein
MTLDYEDLSSRTARLLPGKMFSALGGTRNPNLLIRSQMLYPIELRARVAAGESYLPDVATDDGTRSLRPR